MIIGKAQQFNEVHSVMSNLRLKCILQFYYEISEFLPPPRRVMLTTHSQSSSDCHFTVKIPKMQPNNLLHIAVHFQYLLFLQINP